MNFPLSEQFRISGNDWAEKHAAASLLEETKTSILSQLIGKQGDIAHNKAERFVKSSEEWLTFINTMVAARKEANLARVDMETKRMKFNEWQSKEATARAERKM